MFLIPSVFATGYYEAIYWVRWTYKSFIKHKTELQFVLNRLTIQKNILVIFQ